MRSNSIVFSVFCIAMLPFMLLAGGYDQPMEQPEPIEIEEERKRK